LPTKAAAVCLIASSAVKAFLRKVYPCEFGCGTNVHALDVVLAQVHARTCADIAQTIPLIHAELADANFDIQPVIVLRVDLAGAEMLMRHVLVCRFATLDLGNQASSCFRKVTDSTSHKAFPPIGLLF
jgi:hypothetical protein